MEKNSELNFFFSQLYHFVIGPVLLLLNMPIKLTCPLGQTCYSYMRRLLLEARIWFLSGRCYVYLRAEVSLMTSINIFMKMSDEYITCSTVVYPLFCLCWIWFQVAQLQVKEQERTTQDVNGKDYIDLSPYPDSTTQNVFALPNFHYLTYSHFKLGLTNFFFPSIFRVSPKTDI